MRKCLIAAAAAPLLAASLWSAEAAEDKGVRSIRRRTAILRVVDRPHRGQRQKRGDLL